MLLWIRSRYAGIDISWGGGGHPACRGSPRTYVAEGTSEHRHKPDASDLAYVPGP